MVSLSTYVPASICASTPDPLQSSPVNVQLVSAGFWSVVTITSRFMSHVQSTVGTGVRVGLGVVGDCVAVVLDCCSVGTGVGPAQTVLSLTMVSKVLISPSPGDVSKPTT